MNTGNTYKNVPFLRAVPRNRRIVYLVLSVVIPMLVPLFALAGGARPARLDVIVFDVGEAESIIIRTPGGKNILIDGGAPPHEFDGVTIQSRTVLPLLTKKGITRLDTVILSHSHTDHVAGLVDVLQSLPVGMVYDTGCHNDEDSEYIQCREVIRRRQIPCAAIAPDDTLDFGSGVRGEVFGPPPWRRDNQNDNSVILKVTYGKVRFLFTGDAQKDEELWVVKKYGERLAADILKVPHHGSGTSSSAKFIQTVQPKIAVLSCGLDNPYGHPHAETLYSYRKKGIRLYRTDYDGDITMTTDGMSIDVSTDKK
jgi:competence protein ComEC